PLFPISSVTSQVGARQHRQPPVRRLRQLPMRIGQNADQRRYAIRIADVRERFHGGVPRFAGSPGVERQVRKIIAYGGTSSRLTLLSARCREGRAPHLL